MSDCRIPEPVYERPSGYETCLLHIDFKGESEPWMYALALNGREIEHVFVDGVQFEPVKECSYVDGGGLLGSCSECGEHMGRAYRYCRWCGAKVVNR